MGNTVKARHRDLLKGIGTAVIAGDAGRALALIETLTLRFERDGVDQDSRDEIEQMLQHLNRLAQDSARGSQRAIDQIKDILQNARTLQIYDKTGQRRNMPTKAMMAQRF